MAATTMHWLQLVSVVLGLWQSETLRRLQVDCCNSWVLQHVHLPLALAYEVLDELVTLAINMAIPAWQATGQLLQLPVVRPRGKAASEAAPSEGQLSTTMGRRAAAAAAEESSATLDSFLLSAGKLFGKDPTKWDQVGDEQVEVLEDQSTGKRTIRTTSMCWGNKLSLLARPALFDPRLQANPQQPDLDFSQAVLEISDDEAWQKLTADQPWTASVRHMKTAALLQAKMMSEDPELQHEGVHGMWELCISKARHANVEEERLEAVVASLHSPHTLVVQAAAAAVWGCATTARLRKMLVQMKVIPALLKVLDGSMKLIVMPDLPPEEAAAAQAASGGKERVVNETPRESDREKLQAFALGALAVLLVDAACRGPLIAAEPNLATLLALCSNLEGYSERWASERRILAARIACSCIQRDAAVRQSIVLSGTMPTLLGLIKQEGPGQDLVCFCVAACLASLVLDEAAMEAVVQRKDSPVMFENALALLEKTIDSLDTNAVEAGWTAALQLGADRCTRGTVLGLDMSTAIKLAQAAAQAMWGACYYSIHIPGSITVHHVKTLGRMALHTVENRHFPLSEVAHCLAAALATMASDAVVADLMVATPGVVTALLQLVNTSNDGAFAGSGHVRAAAATAISFLACHPIGAKGDACMTGPHRALLLQEGAMAALLRAALDRTEEASCRRSIERAAAVGVMYLCTLAEAVNPQSLGMLAQLMHQTEQAETMEYLMAGMWILLRNPGNRTVLSTAFEKPSGGSAGGTKKRRALQGRINEAIEVHDVTNKEEAKAARRATLEDGAPLVPFQRAKSITGNQGMAFAADQTQVMTIHSKAEARAAKGNGRIGIVSAKTGIPVAKTGLQSQKSVVPPGTSQLQSEASAGVDDIPEVEEGATEEVEWGLETLVRVGENWIDKLDMNEIDSEDTPLIKLFEFLVASMCLFLIGEGDPISPTTQDLFEATKRPGSASPNWWGVPVHAPEQTMTLSPMLDRALKIMVKLLRMRFMLAYKCMTLSAVTLWNCTARSEQVEQRVVALRLCTALLDIVDRKQWPACLRDMAGGLLQSLLERWSSVEVLGGLRSYEVAMLGLVQSKVPLLELRGVRGLGRLTYKAPFFCPEPHRTVHATKVSVAQADGVPAIVGLVQRCSQRYQQLHEGRSLAATARRATFDAGDQPMEYERNMNNKPAVLETLFCALATLLNLSVRRDIQVRLIPTGGPGINHFPSLIMHVQIAKHALKTLLATNYRFTELAASGAVTDGAEQRIVWLCSGILTNIALHPNNRPPEVFGCAPHLGDQAGQCFREGCMTRFYKAELQGSAAFDSNLEFGADSQAQVPSSTLPPLGKSSVSIAAAMSSRLVTKVWGSEPVVVGADGLPVLESLAHRPKARLMAAKLKPGTDAVGPSGTLATTYSLAESRTDTEAGGDLLTKGDSRSRFLKWVTSQISTSDSQNEEAAAGKQRSFMRALRRMEEAGPEALTPQERCTMRYLNQLLRRPLRDLWSEDPPELRARDGPNRWAPSISEYRQPEEGEPATGAALRLLTVTPPDAITRVLLPTADQLEATGEWTEQTAELLETGTVSMQRPGTVDRQNGRVAMTVLHAHHHLQEEVDAVPSTADPARGDPSKWAGQTGQTLRVVMAPQRARTTICFAERGVAQMDHGTVPRLTVFEHVPGARVFSDLFPDYRLPNGMKAFCYYDAGVLVDEVEVQAAEPPERPTSVPQALQQNMPLASVLDSVARPPGSAPPFQPFRPVPRLVPVPGRHTLPVKHPSKLVASEFGNLREDNLQLILVARRITDKIVTIREEHLEQAPKAEAWSIEKSIWRPRLKESDARAFVDTPACLERMCEADWKHAVAKEKFSSMLSRENKGNKAGKDDKTAMADLFGLFKQHYQTLSTAFMYYSCGGSSDTFHMSLNQFTSFLEDCKIADGDSQYVRRSDCDTIFIVANFQPNKNDPMNAINDEHALMRFEFIEAVSRLAIAKYGKAQETDDIVEAMSLLIQRNMLPNLPAPAITAPNAFRTERLYNEEVDLCFKKHLNLLKAIYSRFRLRPASGGLRYKTMRMDSWMALMESTKLFSLDFTPPQAQTCYMWARMSTVDELKDYTKHEALSFVDFLEAIGRVADMKPLPSRSELDEAGYDNVLAWATDKEAAVAAGSSDPSASLFKTRSNAAGADSRPLYATLEVLLDLMFRQLLFDPSMPSADFSLEACLKLIKKQDKDMGN
eukprot:jgi/Astpho2/5689/fgenesh1_pg.00079_%23_100_t